MPKLTRLPLVSSSPRSLTGAGPAGELPRIAAVSPTFGRPFEGTDVNSAGQTAFQRRSRFTAVTAVTRVKRHADFSSSMLPNGWPALGKPVSFCQCRFRARRPQDKPHTQRSEGAWSVLIHPRLGEHQPRRPTSSHQAAIKRDLSCPHLWITMWTDRSSTRLLVSCPTL